MSPHLRRILVPLAVSAVAVGVVIAVFLGSGGRPPAAPSGTAAPPPSGAGQAGPDAPAAPASSEAAGDAPGGTAPGDVAATDAAPLVGLRAVLPPEDADDGAADVTLGSLDPRDQSLQLVLTRRGAGIGRITLAGEWQTARARLQARAHQDALDRGATPVPPLPDESERYVLNQTRNHRVAVENGVREIEIPVLAVHSLEVNGQVIHLLHGPDRVWAATAEGPNAAQMRTLVVDAEDRPVCRVSRRFELGPSGTFTIAQRVVNESGRALQVRWVQYGPCDLFADRSSYIDLRRFQFGYLLPPQRDPSRRLVLSDPGEILYRKDVPDEEDGLWPNRASRSEGHEIAWFAVANRYFALAVHPALDDPDQGSLALSDVVARVGYAPIVGSVDESVIFTHLFSPVRQVAAGAEARFDMGAYAGPLDRHRMAEVPPLRAMALEKLIVYQMSGCCTACTFQWLAHVLLWFLSLAKAATLDWGIGIILLVCVVRLLLHPLTRKGQISMARFSKQMGELKPEIEKLQKKFAGDSKKLQQEQMRLMRERGVSPVQFLGCLPMFIQMPIWIALYAMLYFAYDLRQEPAFYGIFQTISGGAWPFLADLSSADRFIPIFDQPRVLRLFLMLDYSAINLLPLLMGVLFWVQQKYMTPPTTSALTKEQMQQQKIMKVLMVVMMPLFLYSAPSGLTLYILTSSAIGILESRYVRRHISAMDLAPKPTAADAARRKKPRDALGRAYSAALERARERRRQKLQGPQPRFKRKRK
jgi:YidC/Oxa1 family membrane protein insertase